MYCRATKPIRSPSRMLYDLFVDRISGAASVNYFRFVSGREIFLSCPCSYVIVSLLVDFHYNRYECHIIQKYLSFDGV